MATTQQITLAERVIRQRNSAPTCTTPAALGRGTVATTGLSTTPNGLTSDRLSEVATLRASVCPRGDDGGRQGHPPACDVCTPRALGKGMV
jgi:hypothetical protein